jgi:ABC-2 type transport system ATP-binding protein
VTAPAAEPAIRVNALHKTYAGRDVLAGVSFEVARGELFALLGPNGAGKTTTVEIIEGYRSADGGSVRVLGLDPAADRRQLRARIGLMLQDGGIDPRTTPREALRLYAGLFRDPEDPDGLLELADLGRAATTRYRRLSGGEKQRLGLALALIGRPELLVLDEPTAGMDPAAKQATRDRIAALRGAGTTILLTTHELGDVERLADHVAVLDRGRIVAEGSPAELTARQGDTVVSFTVVGADPGEMSAVLPATTVLKGQRVEFTSIDPTIDVHAVSTWAIERGLRLDALSVSRPTLEDVFLGLADGEESG